MNSLTEIKVKHDQVIVTAAIFAVLATAAVVLRFMTRRMLKLQLKLDDWLILASFVSYLVIMIWEIWAFTVVNKAKDESDPWFIKFMKYEYILAIFYYACAGFANMSVLCLYRRIFPVEPFRQYALGLLVVCGLWTIAGTIAEACFCMPADTFWSSKPHCIFYSTYWMAIMTTEVVINVVTLALPFPQIMSLQLPLKKKLYVAGILLLGAFVVITGPVRIGISYKVHEFNIDIILDGVWMNIHLGTAIICACLPTYRPLVRSSASAFQKLHSKYSSKFSTKYSSKHTSEGSSDAINDRTSGSLPNSAYPSNNSSTTVSQPDRVQIRWSGKEGSDRLGFGS